MSDVPPEDLNDEISPDSLRAEADVLRNRDPANIPDLRNSDFTLESLYRFLQNFPGITINPLIIHEFERNRAQTEAAKRDVLDGEREFVRSLTNTNDFFELVRNMGNVEGIIEKIDQTGEIEIDFSAHYLLSKFCKRIAMDKIYDPQPYRSPKKVGEIFSRTDISREGIILKSGDKPVYLVLVEIENKVEFSEETHQMFRNAIVWRFDHEKSSKKYHLRKPTTEEMEAISERVAYEKVTFGTFES